MTTKLTQPLKWHGGKGAFQGKLAAWIIGLMPPRCKNPNKPAPADPGWLHYVEPYFGGGAVQLALDPEGISEVVGDLNADLTNFWHIVACPEDFEKFLRFIQATPFSEKEWGASRCRMKFPAHPSNVGRAADFFVWCRQSLSGRMKGFASITRNRTRKGMNEQVSAWLNAVEGLPAVHARMIRVLIRTGPALDLIRSEDGPRTLFYLDPPYLHETRATTGEYEHEMTADQHEALLRLLVETKGRFLLSGYRSLLYDEVAVDNGWTRHDFKVPNNAAGGGEKRVMTECVWCNF